MKDTNPEIEQMFFNLMMARSGEEGAGGIPAFIGRDGQKGFSYGFLLMGCGCLYFSLNFCHR